MRKAASSKKVCIVTGAGSGIGLQMALQLAQRGASVGVVCRNIQQAEQTKQLIIEATGNQCIQPYVADLSLQEQIKQVAHSIRHHYGQIDVLIHNAACVRSVFELTAEGIETQFAVNHLAPFLLTHYLLQQIRASKQGRVICVNSRAHGRGSIHFDDVFLSKKYSLSKAYNQSKLANMLFTYRLAEILHSSTVTVNAFHPGLVKTEMGNKGVNFFHRAAWQMMSLLGRSPMLAARDGVYLALEKELATSTGKYFHHQQPIRSSAKSYNKAWEQKVWDISLALTKLNADEYGKIS